MLAGFSLMEGERPRRGASPLLPLHFASADPLIYASQIKSDPASLFIMFQIDCDLFLLTEHNVYTFLPHIAIDCSKHAMPRFMRYLQIGVVLPFHESTSQYVMSMT